MRKPENVGYSMEVSLDEALEDVFFLDVNQINA